MRRVLVVALCLMSVVLVAVVTMTGTAGSAAPAHDEAALETSREREPMVVNHDAETEPEAPAETPVTVSHVPALPQCEISDEPALATGYDSWRLTLLDTGFMLPATYEPPDLVPTSVAFADAASAAAAVGTLRALVIDDLRDLVRDAAAAGHALTVQSAYRSYDYQVETFQYWVDLLGYDGAIATSARAGHSEHQLGTALDFRSLDGPAAWDLDDWATTPEGAWVAANAWRYGFIMSYPPGARDISCYAYEPWHYRYFGKELAATIHGSDKTAREVLWTLAHGGTP